MTCQVTSEDYAAAMRQLLPPGPAWQYEEAATIAAIMLALADSYVALHDRSCDLLTEIIPDTAVEMLPDWERAAGLPDDCTGENNTLEARRAALVSRLRAIGGQSPQYYIDLAATLGYTIQIFTYSPFTAGSSAGDALTNDQWCFAWRVQADSVINLRFRAGIGRAGEPLRVFGNTILECVLNKWKPAHTFIVFDYANIAYE